MVHLLVTRNMPSIVILWQMMSCHLSWTTMTTIVKESGKTKKRTMPAPTKQRQGISESANEG
jgi:hypothetical protein